MRDKQPSADALTVYAASLHPLLFDAISQLVADILPTSTLSLLGSGELPDACKPDKSILITEGDTEYGSGWLLTIRIGTKAMPPEVSIRKPVRLLKIRQAIETAIGDISQLIDLGGGAVLNTAQGIIDKGSASIRLTEKESRILKFLVQSNGSLSKTELLKSVWGYSEDIETKTLETHLNFLRKKLRRIFPACSISINNSIVNLNLIQ